MPRSPKDVQFTVRCSQAERDAWHRHAAEHRTTLAIFVRTVLNNLSGVNDPPDMSLFRSEELGFWVKTNNDTLGKRKRGRFPDPSAPRRTRTYDDLLNGDCP